MERLLSLHHYRLSFLGFQTEPNSSSNPVSPATAQPSSPASKNTSISSSSAPTIQRGRRGDALCADEVKTNFTCNGASLSQPRQRRPENSPQRSLQGKLWDPVRTLIKKLRQ
jgi:hypothetical protein